ncbi:MAG: SLC26A/SulP transporter family protein, partial [Rhodospirillales bacterium]|nr:SLC26A/SulP transporter family protein [Rhodospirillales bacterium]
GVFGAAILSIFSALFGARTILVSGPRAASALIVASLITNLLLSEDLFFPSGQTIPHVISIAFFAILLAGLFQFASGFMRIGNIVKFIPYPVVSAFVNSSALLIISGQSWILLDIRKESNFVEEETFFDLLFRLGEVRPLSVIPAAITIVVMLIVARKLRFMPASLLGLCAGTGAYYAMQQFLGGVDIGATMGSLSSNSSLIDTLGQAASSSPLSLIQFTDIFSSLMAGGDLLAVLLIVVPAAFALAALSSLDTVVSLSTLDEMTEKRTDINQELVGQGIGNMMAALFGGIIGSGGMVRTKPAFDVGGRSPALVLLVSALMLSIAILMADVINYIPRTVISGVIFVLGFQIFDRWSFSILKSCYTRQIFHKTGTLLDAMIIVLVVTVALTFDLIAAVGIGILVSVIVFVSRMSRSLIRNEFRGPGIHARSAWDQRRQSILEKHGHQIAVLELDGAIFFGTADTLETRIDQLIREGLIFIVMDMKRVRDIDSTGAVALLRIKRRLNKAGGDLAVSYVLKERRKSRTDTIVERRENTRVRSLWILLENSGVTRSLGEHVFFSDTDSALAYCEDKLMAHVKKETGDTEKKSKSAPTIFQNLDFDEIKLLRKLSTRHAYQPGESVFSQGDAGDSLYYITKGRGVVLVHLQASGEVKRLGTLLDGAIFGEMALLDKKPRAASIIATEKMICYRLGVDAFESIKGLHHNTAIKLFNNLCILLSERIRSTNTMIAELEK